MPVPPRNNNFLLIEETPCANQQNTVETTEIVEPLNAIVIHDWLAMSPDARMSLPQNVLFLREEITPNCSLGDRASCLFYDIWMEVVQLGLSLDEHIIATALMTLIYCIWLDDRKLREENAIFQTEVTMEQIQDFMSQLEVSTLMINTVTRLNNVSLNNNNQL